MTSTPPTASPASKGTDVGELDGAVFEANVHDLSQDPPQSTPSSSGDHTPSKQGSNTSNLVCVGDGDLVRLMVAEALALNDHGGVKDSETLALLEAVGVAAPLVAKDTLPVKDLEGEGDRENEVDSDAVVVRVAEAVGGVDDNAPRVVKAVAVAVTADGDSDSD